MNDRNIQLRKYANRRYYDVTRSQHVTLEAIHRLILDGYDIHVSDAKSGEDITGKVLAQIILERDPLKLGILPAELWHQIIRANAPLVREFVEKYFSQALIAFLHSQRHFEAYLRGILGLDASMPASNPWARMMLGPFAQPYFGNPGPWTSQSNSADPPDREGQVKELRLQIETLQRQVEAMKRRRDEQS